MTNIKTEVKDKLLSLAVCHKGVRKKMQKGDAVLIVSAAPSRWNAPTQFRHANAQRQAEIKNKPLVGAVVATEIPPSAHGYQTGSRFKGRKDQMYRIARQGDAQTWQVGGHS